MDAGTGSPAALDCVYARITRRVAPLIFVAYVVAYLDRVNVGFAKLGMLADLGFSETVYGLGAGVFFIGYFLFEVPSNLILHRIGARIWIARIMVSWGVISAATMFVSTPWMFYLLRFLLGAAEAGFLPGVILYLTYNDFADALLMLMAVPEALAGGAFFMFLFPKVMHGWDTPPMDFSIAVWVGFIACLGMATETGIIMLVYLREAIAKRGVLENIQSLE